ncbi:tripartite tricarboxylate transporter substrate binding protein [Parasalinivibrio latis]|uniref:Bug family tripartite tricarboxylate transporter substrate binding protein n=1 Tax=Parasalinivibrio latis TaxID=2952610 RepID=UPI0030E25F0E
MRSNCFGKSLFVALALLPLLAPSLANATWKPEKPVRIIVPWGAGGSTDQLVRVLQGELEQALNQKVIVVNQPGGAGAVGTKAAWDAPHDGYTWTAGAVWDLGTYEVTGALDTKLSDWDIFLAVSNFMVLSTYPGSPLQTLESVSDAMKNNSSEVTVATGGINSSGGMAAEMLKSGVGGDYKMVTYDSGNAAVLSTVAKETVLTTQLIAEQYDMLRAKKIKALAAFTPDDVTVPGVGDIPSINHAYPNINTTFVAFGIWAPSDIPKEVSDTMLQIWKDKIAGSPRLAEYAKSKSLAVTPFSGKQAYDTGFKATQIMAWQLFNGGKAKVSPESVGIPPL